MMPPDPQEQIRHLRRQNAILSQRIERIEQSVIFRALRWIGTTASRLLPSARDRDAEYRQWASEADRSAVLPLAAHPETQATAIWQLDDSVTPAVREQGLAALRSQVAKVLTCEAANIADTIAAADTQWTVLVNGPAVLDANAVAAWLGSVGDAQAAYADWDHADPQGHAYAPRFTPEFSPTLLSQAPYFGPAYLIRTELLRSSPTPTLTAAVRVPVMLTRLYASPATLPSPPPPPPRKQSASIIICSRNPGLLDRCLRALAPFPGIEMIVVAHDVDAPNSLTPICTAHGAREIQYRRPFHFGLMNNLGASVASGEIFVFLNDDVFPVSPAWLDALADQLAHPQTGIAGGLLTYPDGSIQHAGIVIGRLPGPTHIGRFMRDAFYWPWLTQTREVAAVTGACLAVRREVWNELGGFDPRFPVNFNDVDLCLRARALGYHVVLESRAHLTHEESVTRRAFVLPEEQELFSSLWGSEQSSPDPFFHPELTLAARDVVLREKRGR